MSCSFPFVSQLIVVLEVIEDSRLPPTLSRRNRTGPRWTQMSRLSFRADSSALSRQVVPRFLALSASTLSACLSSCTSILYVEESRTGHEYIPILKDNFSGYVFLRPCKKADAETTANVLNEYLTTFIPVLQ